VHCILYARFIIFMNNREMIIYITGASGSGKTTLLKKLPIQGYDLDDIYASNWEKHRKIETVQKGVKKDIDILISRHKDIIFVGRQGKEDLVFNPDKVYILVRTDYETFYRGKLVRDLNYLCRDRKELEKMLLTEPLDNIQFHFWSNDIVKMKSFSDFKLYIEKENKIIQKDFPEADKLTADKILNNISRILSKK
jgi:predicted ATPase